MMWETPNYEFRSAKGLGHQSYKKVIIDVTGSAPKSLTEPKSQLENVFNHILSGRDPASTTILDLGAGRLRNSKFFVDKGFQIYCAEFKEMFKEGSKTEEKLLKLKSKKNFHQLIFPKDIFNFQEKFFDIILLINVPTVMPIPVERICLMLIIRRLIKNNGLLLWYSDPMIRVGKNRYVKRYIRKFIDGYLPGKKKKSKETFYVELHENEITTMIELSGFKIDFEYSRQLKKTAYTNIVYSSHPKDKIIFSRALKLEELIKNGTFQKDNYYTSTDFKLMIELLGKELKSTNPGSDSGEPFRYHRIIAYILKNVFDKQLTNMVIEREAREGDIRIDITFRREDKPGFFRNLDVIYKIHCPFIIIECKNYSEDPGNKEYDQLDGRLNKRVGMFGILTVRKIEDKKKCIKNCRDRNRDNNNTIIVLEDSDIIDLIEARVKNPSEINKILHDKIEKIMF